MQWESAVGSFFGSGVLLTALKVLWRKLEEKDRKLELKDAEIASLNEKLEILAERRISDLREMLKPDDSEPN